MRQLPTALTAVVGLTLVLGLNAGIATDLGLTSTPSPTPDHPILPDSRETPQSVQSPFGPQPAPHEEPPPDGLGGVWIPYLGRPVAPPPPDTDDLQCKPHQPIRITEDHGPQGFTRTNPQTGEREYRPGSGVVAGNGTPENPYVIRGWCIQAPPEGHAIHIQDVSAHVRIEDNLIDGYPRTIYLLAIPSHGIHLENVDTAAIHSNYITTQSTGIYLGASNGNLVTGNTIFRNAINGIRLESDTEYNYIANNSIIDSRWDGILVLNSKGTRIVGNTLRNNAWALTLGSTYNAEVARNLVRDNAVGMRAMGAVDRIHNNTVTANLLYGIQLDWITQDTVVRDNNVSMNSGHGIGLTGGVDANRILDNTVTHNDWTGLYVIKLRGETPRENGFHGNLIEANSEAGLKAHRIDHPINATRNWWGDASGPSGGVTDACTGTVADGAGQRIFTPNASACFDPWLHERPSSPGGPEPLLPSDSP